MVNALIHNYDITTLGKCRNNTRDRRKGLRIDDTSRSTEECSNVSFSTHMHILGSVESGRSTRTDSISSNGLNGFLLQSVIRNEVVEVIRRKVRNSSSVHELRFWAGRTRDQ